MKRSDIFLWLLLVLIPVLLFANSWQAYRYNRLNRQIAVESERQLEVIERNKRHLAGIASLSSPARIDAIARERLGLEQNFGGRQLELIRGTMDANGESDFGTRNGGAR